jgi:heme/copper-type cytochrome/quinol oxidase subunit 2
VPAGSRAVETFWAVLPAVGLALLLALTWRALHPAVDPAPRADRALSAVLAAPGAAEV